MRLLLLLMTCAAVQSGAAQNTPLPIHFEPNRGQFANGVLYGATRSGIALGVTQRGARIGIGREVVTVDLLGAGGRPVARGIDPLPGRSNYLLGNDPSRWITDVPHFARVDMRDIHPGIHVTYFGRDGRFEHDFIVEPGADPSLIRYAFTGAQQITTEPGGDLLLKTASAEMRFRKHHLPGHTSGPGRSGRRLRCHATQRGWFPHRRVESGGDPGDRSRRAAASDIQRFRAGRAAGRGHRWREQHLCHRRHRIRGTVRC
ncbi:MAG: hypothetical protein ACRD8O_23650 [Bryobacteraceae bacterium]